MLLLLRPIKRGEQEVDMWFWDRPATEVRISGHWSWKGEEVKRRSVMKKRLKG